MSGDTKTVTVAKAVIYSLFEAPHAPRQYFEDALISRRVNGLIAVTLCATGNIPVPNGSVSGALALQGAIERALRMAAGSAVQPGPSGAN